jgi:uncharacterized membrane protein
MGDGSVMAAAILSVTCGEDAPVTAILSAALPAFLASLVEFVEALTIVLAVGATRGWRSAWIGTLAGATLLTLAVAAFGPLLRSVPLEALQLVVGILLLFFGLRWLRKAILRYAGAIALHDEAVIFARREAELRSGARGAATDWPAIATAFNAVVLEGLEVVFIVIAVGATAGALVPAALGAVLAGFIVAATGLSLRRPLARVPENTLKCAVGIMLSAFGTYWTGEGLGDAWPGGELALVGLVGGYAVAAGAAFAVASRARSGHVSAGRT